MAVLCSRNVNFVLAIVLSVFRCRHHIARSGNFYLLPSVNIIGIMEYLLMSTSLTLLLFAEMKSISGGPSSSLSGDEVMPLDYRAGDSGWLLYGRGLDRSADQRFPAPSGCGNCGGLVMADLMIIRWRGQGSLTGDQTGGGQSFRWMCRCRWVISRNRRPRPLMMDMDSTAIQIECIDEIARLANGVGDEVAEK